MMRVVESLDRPVRMDDDQEETTVEQVSTPLHPALLFDDQELSEVLKNAIAKLPRIWADAIIHYFELGGKEKLNLRQLSEAMGTSRATQAYRIKQGLKQLRALPELQAFWGAG